MSIDLKAIFHFEEDFVCHNGLSRKIVLQLPARQVIIRTVSGRTTRLLGY